MIIEGKTYVGSLDIELQGTHGIKLIIKRPNIEDIMIIVDKTELKEVLGDLIK